MARKKPTIYLDTTVLREAMKSSKPSSLKIFDFLKQRKCILEISMFSIGELYDLEKDNVFFKTQVLSGKDVKAISHIRKQRNLTPHQLNEIAQNIWGFLESNFPLIKVDPDEKDWKTFNIICTETNLTWQDALHLTLAVNSADALLTSDEGFLKEAENFLRDKKLWGEFRISKPDSIINNFSEMGFKL
jgi:predicted nucleic acid-binding protein